MPLIEEEDRKKLEDLFATHVEGEVKIALFTQEEAEGGIPVPECPFCKETREFMEEVAGLSDKIKLTVYDFVADAEKAKEYGVDKIPAIVFERSQSHNIKYFGIPTGYEFATLVGDIVDISKGTTDLKPKTREELAKIDKDVHIQVFVTPA